MNDNDIKELKELKFKARQGNKTASEALKIKIKSLIGLDEDTLYKAADALLGLIHKDKDGNEVIRIDPNVKYEFPDMKMSQLKTLIEVALILNEVK
jgi:hypothetical protein